MMIRRIVSMVTSQVSVVELARAWSSTLLVADGRALDWVAAGAAD